MSCRDVSCLSRLVLSCICRVLSLSALPSSFFSVLVCYPFVTLWQCLLVLSLSPLVSSFLIVCLAIPMFIAMAHLFRTARSIPVAAALVGAFATSVTADQQFWNEGIIGVALCDKAKPSFQKATCTKTEVFLVFVLCFLFFLSVVHNAKSPRCTHFGIGTTSGAHAQYEAHNTPAGFQGLE
jgi:hypothetical protein